MRRTIALAAGLVVSTLLLGGGWLASTLRERDARMVEARAELVRSAGAVRAAVDESLEELREREHQRHFYLYNHYYSPPDVLAITDPVAISPLARAPLDGRIVGHFQVEPGGGVRTPYAPDDREEPPLARRVRSIVSGDAFASIRALASGDDRGTMLARPQVGERGQIDPESSSGMLSLSMLSAQQEAARLDVPLTTNLGEWGNVQAQDIQAAQAGDVEASARVMQRGRQAPIISRRNVTWEEAEQQQQAPSSSSNQRSIAQQRPARPASRAAVESALAGAHDAVLACSGAAPLSARVTLSGEDGRAIRVEVEGTSDAAEVSCVREVLRAVRVAPFDARSIVVRYAYRGEAPIAAPTQPSLHNMVRRETDVEYTPMVFREVGDAIVLHRIVSHGGASVVQGVLLDRDALVQRWIPSVVSRHVERRAPSVVREGEGECAVRRSASSVVPGVELCFSPAALASAIEPVDAELGWQIGALLALWAGALFAAAAIVGSARRAEALSRQKSAFVSAVSHELRTPLTTLRMHAEMLEEGLVTEERRPKVHAELVRESVRLARLVDNVLSLSKLEEGRRRIRTSEGDLRSHVREIVEGQRRFVLERGFALTAPEGEPLDARFDAQAVEQIVVNLLDNAVKYGGGETRAIEVEVVREGGAPAIVVRDRGPGIPASERQRVFERFHRVEREETAHAPGTGIGLALVAELAQAHGGAASVCAREGGGLEVRVLLGPTSAR